MNAVYRILALVLFVALIGIVDSVNWTKPASAQAPQPVDLEISIAFPEENFVEEPITTTVVMTNTSALTVETFSNFQIMGIMENGGDYAKGFEFFFAPNSTITETLVFTPQQIGEFDVLANIQQIGQKEDLDPSDNVVETTILVDAETEIPVEPSVTFDYEAINEVGNASVFTVGVQTLQEEAVMYVRFLFNDNVVEEESFALQAGSSDSMISFSPSNSGAHIVEVELRTLNDALLTKREFSFVVPALGEGPTIPDGWWIRMPSVYSN